MIKKYVVGTCPSKTIYLLLLSFISQQIKRYFLLAYRNTWTLDARVGRWTLDDDLWTLDSGPWTLSLTVVEQNQNPVSNFA